MLDDKTRALFGDRSAQERLTAAGVLLPCPFCGGPGMDRGFNDSWVKWVSCKNCYCDGETAYTKEEAIRNWNTRAAILTQEQLTALERMEDDGVGEHSPNQV